MKQEQQNPYATPDSNIESVEVTHFLDPNKRATLTIKAFYAVMVSHIVYIVFQFWRQSTFKEYLATQSNYEQLIQGDQLETALAVILLALIVVLAILFLRWFHLCYKNLSALEIRDLEHSPGWAVGWFFIPFANLVKPYSVAYEMWTACESDDEETSANWVVIVWWMTFLVSSFFDRFVMTRVNKAESLEDYLDIVSIDTAASVVSIIGAAFAVNFVKRLTERQCRRYESLAG